MLKKGDPCLVRIHTGEIVEAKYYQRLNSIYQFKEHIVRVGGGHAIASRRPEEGTPVFMPRVRFVAMGTKVGNLKEARKLSFYSHSAKIICPHCECENDGWAVDPRGLDAICVWCQEPFWIPDNIKIVIE